MIQEAWPSCWPCYLPTEIILKRIRMFCTQLTTPLMSVSEVDGGAADVDECAVFGGSQLCSHICVNTIGSFRCECERGHKLAADGRTCYRDGRGHWFIFLDILYYYEVH